MYLLCYEQPKSSVISYAILIIQYHASSYSNQTHSIDEQYLLSNEKLRSLLHRTRASSNRHIKTSMNFAVSTRQSLHSPDTSLGYVIN
jgi:hypothetical protein